MVLREVRRLFPSVWMILRFVREDTRVDDYAVPAGSVVMASAQIMHRDPRFFSEPYLFDPRRWTPEATAERAASSYFPFSEGARACAGETFAKIQDVLDRREKLRRRIGQRERRFGAVVTFFGTLLEPDFSRGDDGDLRHGEDAVGKDQQENDDDLEADARHGSRL